MHAVRLRVAGRSPVWSLAGLCRGLTELHIGGYSECITDSSIEVLAGSCADLHTVSMRGRQVGSPP